jgi:hypothetical protein
VINYVAEVDPVIQALFKRLPALGTKWPLEHRKQWLIAMAAVFDVIYSRGEDPTNLPKKIEVDILERVL